MHHAFEYVTLMEPISFHASAACRDPPMLKAGAQDVVVDNLANDLLELFPVEHLPLVGRVRFQSRIDPPLRASSYTSGKRGCQPPKPTKRTRRNRKRTDKQKTLDREKRKIKQGKSKNRRDNCLDQEYILRESICSCINWCADALGLPADASILPFLPQELQGVVAKADAAILAFRDFSGQKTLIEQLNKLPTWW